MSALNRILAAAARIVRRPGTYPTEAEIQKLREVAEELRIATEHTFSNPTYETVDRSDLWTEDEKDSTARVALAIQKAGDEAVHNDFLLLLRAMKRDRETLIVLRARLARLEDEK